jgi:DNA modification methylase
LDSRECQTLECLGRSFPSEEARRAYFQGRLRARLRDPAFRRAEGFPLAADEDILALSDPPYFTACPNPFLAEFCYRHARPDGRSSPAATQPHRGDLRSSTRHPVYAFHPYHTKVPPEVIRTLIEHYTEPGDLVLDGFGGSGMTGVAAREAGRHAVLADLSPAACFIAGVNCRSHDGAAAVRALHTILDAGEAAWGHLYRTREGGRELPVNYCVWSDVFTCPDCGHEFPFFPHGVRHHGDKVETRRRFPCPACGSALNVRRVRRVVADGVKRRALVWVNAGAGRQRVNRAPNAGDRALAAAVEGMRPPSWYPRDGVDPGGYSARLAQLGDKAITDVSRFLSPRNLIVFADLWERAGRLDDAGLRNLCMATLTSIFTVVSERQGYFGGGGGMSGNLYMPIVRMEKNVHAVLRRKLRKLEEAERAKEGLRGQVLVTTQSATRLPGLPDASVDYVYTDPPFGANIIYSEMNLLLEAWLRVKTNAGPEAVIDASRGRDGTHYAELMRACFREYYRVLKPGRWLTVEFHNTSAGVWNLVQQVIGESGFVVAQISVFDKGSTTILADIRPAAAKHDLLISAYKPGAELERRFRLRAGSAEAAWDFVREHLARLPPCGPGRDRRPQRLAERTSHRLFGRMVAFHVQRQVAVPLSAAEFRAGLDERFIERDGMYFLREQEAERGALVAAPSTRLPTPDGAGRAPPAIPPGPAAVPRRCAPSRPRPARATRRTTPPRKPPGRPA